MPSQETVVSVPASDTGPKHVSAALGAVAARRERSESEVEREAAEREQGRRGALLSDVVKSAGGERYRGHTFAAWKASTDYQGEVKKTVLEWAETYPDRRAAGENLILYGPVGTGKDHLAMAAVGLVIARFGPESVAWRNGRELAGAIRDAIDQKKPETDTLGAVQNAELLILADPLPPFGDLKDHQADMLYRIIERRYAANRTTVITVNVKDDAEADQRFGAATWDRLCHGAWKVACFWDTYRKPTREVRPKQ